MAAKKATKTRAQTKTKRAPIEPRKAKKAPAKGPSAEDQLLSQISKDTEKLLEGFIQKQYAALSDFASDVVVATAKRLLENHKCDAD
jgi:hypothetical protein